jgi:hypothetical protein
MRRLSTLTVLAIFAPVACAISFIVLAVIDLIHHRRRTAKYRHGLPRSVAASIQAEQDQIIADMIAASAYGRR